MALSAFTPDPVGVGGSITIYLNGQIVAIWDARDDKGKFVPNSFYHFVMEEHSAEGNIILLERDAFVSPYHGEVVALMAAPNIGRPGDILQFTASFAGNPADGRSKLRIYTIAGELVQSLPFSGGAAAWDLTNANGQTLASGVYLGVLDGIDPTNGQKFNKVIKLLLTR